MSIKYDGKGLQLPTLAELSKPLAHLDAQHDALEDKISFIESESAKYDHIIANEPDSEAAKNYKVFVEGKNKIAEQLNTQGILSNNMRKNVLSLNTAFNKNILPIANAYELKKTTALQEKAAQMANPDLRFLTHANEISIDEYAKGPPKQEVVDLKEFLAAGASVGKIISSISRGQKLTGSDLAGYQTIAATMGYSLDELQTDEDILKMLSEYKTIFKQSYPKELVDAFGEEMDSKFQAGIAHTAAQTTNLNMVSDKLFDLQKNKEYAIFTHNLNEQAAIRAEERAVQRAEDARQAEIDRINNEVPEGMYYSPEVEATGNNEGIVKDASKTLVWLDRSQQSPNWGWFVKDPKQIEITERFVNTKLSKLENVEYKTFGNKVTPIKTPKENLTPNQKSQYDYYNNLRNRITDYKNKQSSSVQIQALILKESIMDHYKETDFKTLQKKLKEIEMKGTHVVSSNILFKPDANRNMLDMTLKHMKPSVGNKLKNYIDTKDGKLVIKQGYSIDFKYEPYAGQISAVVSKNGAVEQRVIIPEEYFNIKTTDNLSKVSKIAVKINKLNKELNNITDSTEIDRLSNEIKKLRENYASQLIQNGVEFNNKLEIK